jgi:hypothetical protein
MHESLNVGEWTSTDVEILSGAAAHCLLKIEETSGSRRLGHRIFLKQYIAHLADPEYLMPLNEDREFISLVCQQDLAQYMRVIEPIFEFEQPIY